MIKAMGVGRFVKYPTLKPVGDTHVCEFSLAVNEFRKINGERRAVAHFFDFTVWDKAAEVICKYKKKGDMLEFVATPRQEKWETEEGKTRSKVTFRIDDFTFISSGRPPEAVVETHDVVEVEEVEEEEEVAF